MSPNEAQNGVELLACPCGAPVDPDECPYPTGRGLFKIACVSSDCGWFAVGVSESDAIRMWHTRANVEASVAPILAERDAYKAADESMQQAHYEACVRARAAEARAERLAEALRYAVAQVPELATVPGIAAALTTTPAQPGETE